MNRSTQMVMAADASVTYLRAMKHVAIKTNITQLNGHALFSGDNIIHTIKPSTLSQDSICLEQQAIAA